jgi:hypothetical protein
LSAAHACRYTARTACRSGKGDVRSIPKRTFVAESDSVLWMTGFDPNLLDWP